MRLTLLATLALLAAHAHAADTPASDASPNRLIHSQSPYLLQHARNPVDWFPWGDEAFEKAKTENKLVFISIGYSTCHWCHVMNRESFSNEEIAAYLNENYVCIKIDREERPDVDGVYMNFVQNLTGSGGWPLNVWLTPDRRPFYGGTYFPPHSEGGRPGFHDLIQQIQGMWTQDEAGLLSRSEQIVNALNQGAASNTGDSAKLSLDILGQAISAFHFRFDTENAGFGSDEKFPSPANLSFLLRASRIPELHKEDRELAKEISLKTLDAIADGGIRDHIGGGFHRYTVDSGWQLPHFEKMLYDQALLAEAFIDAWQLTSNEPYKTAATETLDYLIREMRNPNGGFYSAEDAESIDPENPDTKREGAFYVWTTADIDRLVPEPQKRELAKAYFNIHPTGNAPYGNFPTEELEGYNTLRIQDDLQKIAANLGIEASTAKDWIAETKRALFAERETRARPHLDDKIITAWNGLAISALARAAQAFERPDYAQSAEQAAAFIKSTLYNSETKQLARLYRNSVSEVSGFSEDYAFLIDGLIDLYEATAKHEYLSFAHDLQNTQDALFYDSSSGGYYSFAASDDIVFEPSKASFDGAIPTPSSISSKNLARLSQFFDSKELAEKARNTIAAFMPGIQESPTRMPALLDALSYVAKKPLQIVLAGNPQADDIKAMLKVVNSQLLPNRAILFADNGAGQEFLGQSLEFIQTVTAFNGHATAYVCENYVCQLPTEDIEKLKQQLVERFE